MRNRTYFFRWLVLFLLSMGGLTLAACAPDAADVAESSETRTLNSLKKVDDHPLYSMHYYGAYTMAATSVENTVSATFDAPDWACSLFAAFGDADSAVYGRNFDWEHSPAVLLFTDPPDGYASVSMVDIAYLDFSPVELRDLTKLSLERRRPLLDAPSLPFDGMNEYGLAVGMAAVPDSAMPRDPDNPTIGSLGIIREALDHARTVDEAVAVMQGYNVSMRDGPAIHYLIADAAGKAVLVEYYQGEMVVIPNERDWHQATNFLISTVKDTSVAGRCARYDTIAQRLTDTAGQLLPHDALTLLADVAQVSTQWSVVYEMRTGDVNVVMGRDYSDIHTFNLTLAGESTP